MNASGVPNTCKSNGELAITLSGERVSNALVTYPKVWDTRPKGLLIPHVVKRVEYLLSKGVIRFGMGLRPIS